MTGRHILVVDDDPAMRDLIGTYFTNHGYEVSTAPDGPAVKRVLNARPADLIILDLQLAKENGLDLMRGISSDSQVPVIIITGQRRDEPDRVVALELGADDYVTKPFSLRELMARTRAVLRRSERADGRSREIQQRIRYRFAGFELSVRMRRLTSPHQTLVKLTVGEFNLLTAFLRSPQQILSREQLIAATRLHDEEVFDRSIDVLILRLRRKLEADPSNPQLIRTERGVGYLFNADVEVVR
ncbi:MAG: DNA-binding response regulator [Fulvimarina sp.]|nr:DNA-binding response regulator [Fulvimarina sp.]